MRFMNDTWDNTMHQQDETNKLLIDLWAWIKKWIIRHRNKRDRSKKELVEKLKQELRKRENETAEMDY